MQISITRPLSERWLTCERRAILYNYSNSNNSDDYFATFDSIASIATIVTQIAIAFAFVIHFIIKCK